MFETSANKILAVNFITYELIHKKTNYFIVKTLILNDKQVI